MFITLHLEVGHHIRFNIRRLLTDLLFFIHSIFSRFNYESLCAELTQCNDDKQCHFLLSYAMDFSMQFTDQYTEYKNANVALFANLFLSVCRFFFISSNFKQFQVQTRSKPQPHYTSCLIVRCSELKMPRFIMMFANRILLYLWNHLNVKLNCCKPIRKKASIHWLHAKNTSRL